MKALIITYYWPPSGGSGVQRWLKFVKYLPEYGVTPVVYTADNPEYAVTDTSLNEDVSPDLKVLRGSIWEPNNLLSKIGSGQKNVSSGFLEPRPSLANRLLRFIRANVFIPDARMFWIRPSVRLLTEYLKTNEIDVIITTGPPHSVHLIGLALKKRFGLNWVADFRDPWTSIDYFHKLPLTRRSIEKHQNLEKEVLRFADRVIVVSGQMKEEFLPFNKEIRVIPNGYDDARVGEETGLDSQFTLTYAGLMNADRNPTHLWKVLGQMVEEDPDLKRDLRIRFVGSTSGEVFSSLEENGLAANSEHLGYLDHQDVSRYQRSAQVLLLTVNRVPSARGIVTGKIFEYLQSGRPVLAVGPTDGDLAQIMSETRCGRICDFEDEEGMRDSVQDLYRRFKNGSLSVETTGVERFHRRNLTGKLFEMLEEMQSFDSSDNKGISKKP